jgi:O-antigen biosynthesis protein WbqP
MIKKIVNLFFLIFKILIIISLIVLLIFPFALIAIFIKFTSKGPVLHWSKRIGKDNNPFLMPKFRTMKNETPNVATHLLNNENYHVTRFGKHLRKLSLDEIPQLYSILKGDMNFIGPRPALFNQVDLIKLRTINKIHRMKPGITGWAQVNGRDAISIEEKVNLEIEYLKINSFKVNILIFFKTLYEIFKKNNISH